ncbi:MAG: GNAT family N-acetyltransferase [Clostridiales Family XIII bacterium]|jgi:GNAT superfamily N-acetyltransferase|nr:GNAT family N-acetyltransferase [Clostridiales Family XIII bacterium]
MKVQISVLDKTSAMEFHELIPLGMRKLPALRPGDYAVMGAALDGSPCGAIVAAPETDGISLTHMYVSPHCRRLGIGARLLDKLLTGLPESPGAKLSCRFTRAGGGDEPDPTFDFLSHRGFRIAASGESVFKTTLKSLENLPFWRRDAETSDSVKSFRSLDPYEIRAFNKKTMYDMDLLAPPYSEEDALPGVSCAIVTGGRVCGVAAVTGERAAISLSWLHCERAYAKHLPDLLKAVYVLATLEMPPDTELYIAALNESSVRLGEKLCPPGSRYPVFRAEADIGTLKADASARARVDALGADAENRTAWWDDLWAVYA